MNIISNCKQWICRMKLPTKVTTCRWLLVQDVLQVGTWLDKMVCWYVKFQQCIMVMNPGGMCHSNAAM